MLYDCRRTLKIWSKDSKYGVLSNDEPPLMRCPYPKTWRKQQSRSIFVELDEALSQKKEKSEFDKMEITRRK